MQHTTGTICLGKERGTSREFSLFVDVTRSDRQSELAQHVFLLGSPGSGKTTLIMLLVDGALLNGYGVVIVDCKGGGLGDAAKRLADRYGVDFFLVDPEEPDGLGYDPCSGNEIEVSNKLTGAFTFSDKAEIYKNVVLSILPPLHRAMIY